KGYGFFEQSRSAPNTLWQSDANKHFDNSFFVEAPSGTTVARFVLQPKKDSRLWGDLRKEFHESSVAHYGYTWREVRRPMDRDLGVVGGELIVVDLTNGDVLGFRRGFAYSGYVRNVSGGFQWEIAQMCPARPQKTGGDLAPGFVQRVLIPKPQTGGHPSGSK